MFACKKCGFQAGIFNLKGGLCGACRNRGADQQALTPNKEPKNDPSEPVVLWFKTNEGAFGFQLSSFDTDLREGHAYPAYVEEVSSFDEDRQQGVYWLSVDDTGMQKAGMLFKPHEKLAKGDLVLWRYNRTMPNGCDLGSVLAILEPAYDTTNQEWLIKQEF
jgi:hypothetical protein